MLEPFQMYVLSRIYIGTHVPRKTYDQFKWKVMRQYSALCAKTRLNFFYRKTESKIGLAALSFTSQLNIIVPHTLY